MVGVILVGLSGRLKVLKRRFNDIRARLLMRFKSHGSFAPKDEVEKFVAEIIEAKHELDKKVEEYKEIKNMKKMMMVLMMVFGLSAVFVSCATTAPVDTSVYIDAGDWFIATNSDNKPVYFDTYSDDRKVEIYKSLVSEEINGKRVVYDGFEFHKVGWVAEKYYTYFLVKKDETYMVAVVDVGDGRELRLYHSLEDIVE